MSVQEKLQGIRQEVPQFTQGHAQLFQRAKIALRLGLVLTAPAAIIACDGASGVEPSVPMSIPLPTEMINPLDAQATGVPTVAPGANGQQQPEVPTVEPQPSPTPKVVGLMAESPGINESDWLPPTIEDTILTNQAGGGGLPPQLQPLIDQAQATIAATGFAQARVEAVTNGQNSDAFRAAFVFRVPEGIMWAQGSAYPSQLNPDGSVSRSYAYVLVPGSADARIEWTHGADGSRDTETTLVKHTANLPDGRQAALLYWHTTEQTWKPIGGYPTAQEFVAVGDTVYQFSPEDGSAVEIGTIAALQSLSTNNGRVEATDASGQVFWFENGRFVNEALLAAEASAAEARRVAEYVEANTEPINRVEMPLLEFRASDRLQEVIKDKLPDDLQALGDEPLYMIVPDPERLRAVIDGLSIHVVGKEDKVPLAGRNVEFVFLSADENEFDLPYYQGWSASVTFKYGAYQAEDGTVQIVIQTAPLVSTSYAYDANEMETEMVWGGVLVGLQILTEGQLSILNPSNVSNFQRRFSYDSEWDDNFLGLSKNSTSMMWPYVVQSRSPVDKTEFFQDLIEWLPPEYLHLILPNR